MSDTRNSRSAADGHDVPGLPDGTAFVLALAALLLLLPLVGFAWIAGQPNWLLCAIMLLGGPVILLGLLAGSLARQMMRRRRTETVRELQDA